MHLKQIPLLYLSIALLPSTVWADGGTPADLSATGAFSIGTGALSVLATPLVFPAALSDGENPIEASAATISAPIVGSMVMSQGIVYLLEGTGKGLSELTVDTIKSTRELSYLAIQNIPTVTVQIHTRNRQVPPIPKTIPLCVRKEYVHMNDKIQE